MSKKLIITLVICTIFKNNPTSLTTENVELVRPPNSTQNQDTSISIAPNNANPGPNSRPNLPQQNQRTRRLQRLGHHTLNYNSPDVETQINSLNTLAERQLAKARLRSSRSRNERANRRGR
jgi:hypothetical protein